MNPSELLRIVESIHREKRIDKEVIFQSIEAGLVSAIRKRYEEGEIQVHMDYETGSFSATLDGVEIPPSELAERIGAQSAKQVMLQRIRDAESDRILNEYASQLNQMVTGVVHRCDSGRRGKDDEGEGKGKGKDDDRGSVAVTVTLPNVDAVLPVSEQLRKDRFRVGDRVRAVIADVRKQGSRVKVTLSRVRPIFVTRLFEQEIPEIADGVIEIRSISRKPGVRSKVAVWSADKRVDCVGACVGVRGNRIRNITDELADERIDIIPWSDDIQEMISNALQPARVDDIILCDMLGRAIVLVDDENLSLAIGRQGQNVNLASKLCGLDISVMTGDELQIQLETASSALCTIPGITPELAETLVGGGYMSYDDLSIIEPEDLMRMGNLSEDEVNAIVEEADRRVRRQEAVSELCSLDGITPELAGTLVDSGFDSLKELTLIVVEELARLGGFSPKAAMSIITDARHRVRQQEERLRAREWAKRDSDGRGSSLRREPRS